jgi:uncharacterized cupredoxin-like copper-binding protein
MPHRTSRRSLLVAAVAVIAGLVVAGCGGGGGSTSASGASSNVGQPGDPAQATRTVEVRAGDDLRFQPDQVQVKVGETVTFKVINTASVEHDFTLGDDAAQGAHEKEMRAMASGDMTGMQDDANAIHIPPGATKTITWTFTKAGTTIYGCHEPGHYASGMKGTITAA